MRRMSASRSSGTSPSSEKSRLASSIASACSTLLAPALGGIAEAPFELQHGLPALRLGLGIDEIGETLDPAEVHPPVEKGPAGELAGLGRPAIGDGAKRPQHGGPRGKPAMDMKLGLILAGKARRPRHPEHQRLIEGLAGRRIAQDPHDRAPGLRHRVPPSSRG